MTDPGGDDTEPAESSTDPDGERDDRGRTTENAGEDAIASDDSTATDAAGDGTDTDGRRDGSEAGDPDDPNPVRGDPEAVAGDDEADGPSPSAESADESQGPIQWFLSTDHFWVATVREAAGAAVMVALVGLVLFAISGIWPPLVAVQSGSMEPHMHRGDLVFLVDDDRFVPDPAHGDTGVVTYREGREVGYRSLGDYGSVIVYQPDGKSETPIIHRAMFWVEEDENWYDKGRPIYMGNHDSCSEIPTCPAQHSGFITKGDANPGYDQVYGQSDVVKPEWIRGVARVRIPWLGWVRLHFGSTSPPAPVATASGPEAGGFRPNVTAAGG